MLAINTEPKMSLVRGLYRSKHEEVSSIWGVLNVKLDHNLLLCIQSQKTCHNNEMIVWRTHIDEIVAAIRDPDGLAEEASKDGLILTSLKECLTNAVFPDKVLTVLLTIDSRIRENLQLLHTRVVPVLKRQPGLARVVSTLQANLYGE